MNTFTKKTEKNKIRRSRGMIHVYLLTFLINRGSKIATVSTSICIFCEDN
jgi:hypothetical protein